MGVCGSVHLKAIHTMGMMGDCGRGRKRVNGRAATGQMRLRSLVMFVQYLCNISPRVSPHQSHTWIQSRISHPPPIMSSFESSSLEEQMRGRLLFYSESVTPPRVQRSTALIHREIAIQYALAPSGNFDLIIYPGSTQPFDGGWADLFFLSMADRDDLDCTAWGA